MKVRRFGGNLKYLLPLLILLAMFAPARAQIALPTVPSASSAPAQPDLSQADIDRLVAQLNDPVSRAKLIATLQSLSKAEAKADAGKTSPIQRLGDNTYRFLSEHWGNLAGDATVLEQAFEDFPKLLRFVEHRSADPAARSEYLLILATLVLVLSSGWLASFAVTIAISRPRRRLERTCPPHLGRRTAFAAMRAGLLCAPVAAFALAATLVDASLNQSVIVELTAHLIVQATVIFLLVLILARFVLAPDAPGLRMMHSVGGHAANYLYHWTRRLSGLVIYTYFTLLAVELIGLPHAASRALLKLAIMCLAILLLVLIGQNRQPVRNWMRRDRSQQRHLRHVTGLTGARIYFAAVWHLLAMLFVAVTFCTWLLDVEGGLTYILRASAATIGAFVVARVLAISTDRVIDHGIGVSRRIGDGSPILQSRLDRYLPGMRSLLHWLIFIGLVLCWFYAWGIDSFAWLSLKHVYMQKVLSILLVVAISMVCWELIAAGIERILLPKSGSSAARSARMRTLLPLLRNFCFIFIVTIAAMVVLGEMGLDTRPLLAGAGVIGVALGFGSQTLVKDVITGMFILFENSVAVGDVVDLGKQHSGVVEGLTIRTLKLRDGNGAIHTVPFSEVTSIINMSRDHSFYVVDLTINYAEDTDRVVAAMKDVAAGIEVDPAYSGLILAPLDVWGVDGFLPSGMNIKAALKTKPLQQWTVAREFNRRLKKRFDEMGILPPMQSQKIYQATETTRG
jgi:small conductance mechanosensitive channel